MNDLERGKMLGIVGGRGKSSLERYFTALPDPEVVEVVVMDMHEQLRQAVQMCLPKLVLHGWSTDGVTLTISEGGYLLQITR